MLRLFKYNSLGQILIILLTAAALWSKAFVDPIAPQASQCFAPLYDLVYGWLSGSPRLDTALALLLVLVEGVWLNVLLYNHKVVASNSFLPTYLYLLAMSWNPSTMTLTPILFVNLAVLMACNQLLTHGSTTLEVENNFNASFCIGLAALFYLPALSHIVPLLLVFVYYKLYRWRHIAISFFGLIAPLIILFTYAFLDDKLSYWLILIGFDLVNVHIRWDFTSVPNTILGLALMLLLLVSLMSQIGSRDKVTAQRINTGVMALPLVAVVIMSLYGKLIPIDTQMMAIPFGTLATAFILIDRKRKWINETIIWLLILCTALSVWIAN